MITVSDGPRHTQIRSIMREFFTPRRVQTLRHALTAGVRTRLDPLLDEESFDFAGKIARYLPMEAMSHILGLPDADHEELLLLVSSTLGGQDPDCRMGRVASNSYAAHIRLLAYIVKLAAKRRTQPTDDLVSALVGATAHRHLSDREVAANCMDVIIAANETTKLALSGATAWLAEQPSHQTDPEGHVSDLRTLGEEILRWYAPPWTWPPTTDCP